MELVVNGRVTSCPEGAGLRELLTHLGLAAGSVVVEHNGTALVPSELDTVPLRDGDRLELVRAVAGG